MNPKDRKIQLLEHCQNYVTERLERIQQTISDIQQSLTAETKSTAGDKHETGRAMLQLEREKAGKQLAEVQKLQEILAKVNVETKATHVHLGSIVMTSQLNYFISISMGKIKIANQSYYAIAANAPIGRILLGKTKGDVIMFNQQEIHLKEVL